MPDATPSKLQDGTLSALRIVAALAFFSHGGQKIFGWFGGFGPDGTAELMTRFGAAGMLEVVLGVLLLLGLFTRAAAFIASGEMAVAYFWMHWAGQGEMWWWQNGGELPLLYCFIWLFFSARGAGSFSLDATMRRKKEAPAAPV